MNRSRPIGLGWTDYDLSRAPDWDRAQIQRLARHLGYHLEWPCERSVRLVAVQAHNIAADLVILPAPHHLNPSNSTQ